MNTPRSTSTAAVLSLVFGVLAWVLLPLLGAIVAIIAGHVARGDIRRSGGALEGDALALVGLILGWLQLLLVAAALMFAVFVLGGIAALMIWAP